MNKIKFWLPGLYLLVILFNILGYDDKNIFLFHTSPPMWLFEEMLSIIPKSVLYFITVLFWYILGLLGDNLVLKYKKK